MIENLPSLQGLFTAKLWTSQIVSKVCGVEWLHAKKQFCFPLPPCTISESETHFHEKP